MSCGGAYGMELATTKPSLEQLMQGSLFLSFPQIGERPDLLIEARETLRKKIVKGKDDKAKKASDYFLTLFNVATQLPKDIQREIVVKMLNNDDVQTDKLFNGPIRNILRHCFYWQAHRVMDGTLYPKFVQYIAFSPCEFAQRYPVSTVCSLLPEMKTFEFLLEGDKLCNRKQCEEILTLAGTFDRIKDDFSVEYNCRKAYTRSNFCQSISETQGVGFMLLAMPVLSAYIHQNLCVAIPDQEIVDENIRRAISNEALKVEYERTGNPILRTLWEVYDPMGSYSYKDWAKMIMPHMFFGPSMTAFDIYNGRGWSPSNKWRIFHEVLLSLTCAVVTFGVSVLFYNLAALDIFQPCKNSLVMSGSILALYALGCSVFNIKNMRKLEKESIEVKNLSLLLKRTDIVIA